MSVICDYAGCENQLRQTFFYNSVRQLIYILHEFNIIVIVLSVIIAFGPYRQAILSIFGKQKLSIVKIKPLNSAPAGNVNNVAMMVNSIAMVKMKK
uniref:7TM_GPCR_Srx domain-containing protein n=1 Tax=Elaeophora elaphi TaxID=1147741 RepID=A0A0R3RP25_9BILA